jgi:NAD(P)-dependent dehydrogenase (short-subunit alcohol dehydrogenase family)
MNLRVIFITGANGGLGQAIASAFLQESPGNVVWLGVRANRERADRLAQEHADRCFCVTLDVATPASWVAAKTPCWPRCRWIPGGEFWTPTWMAFFTAARPSCPP